MLGYLSAPEVASGYFVANFGTWERKQKSPLALFYVPQHQHAVRRHIKKGGLLDGHQLQEVTIKLFDEVVVVNQTLWSSA